MARAAQPDRARAAASRHAAASQPGLAGKPRRLRPGHPARVQPVRTQHRPRHPRSGHPRPQHSSLIGGKMTKIAVLDDWQNVARSSADWGPLEAMAELVFFQEAFTDEDEAARQLAEFDIVMAMRERTAFPASLVRRLPKLKLFSL